METKTQYTKTTIMLSGFRKVERNTEMDEIVHQEVSDEDRMLTETIRSCGSNKSKYRQEIIQLFRQYVEPAAYLCTRCGSEVFMAWTNYLMHYDKKYNK